MDLTGQTFAGLEVISQLGRGGMGAVYKARQPLLNRLVALKVMSPKFSDDPDFISRFVREAASAAKLHHDNMVLVHSAGEQNGTYYIVMEYVEGHSLHEHIQSKGRLDPAESLAVTIHIAQALQYAWKKAHIIHRDIKPANIFLSTAGEVKVGDLGLAKSIGESTGGMTQTGMVVGSPHYIAPEQARGMKDIDFRADIYSLGCTLFHMLTGQPPYDGSDSMSIMMKHVSDPPPAIFKALPTCPVPLGRLVGRMLAKNPKERFQSYEELIAEVYAVTEKLAAISAKPTAVSAQPAVTPAKAQPQPKAAAPTPTIPMAGRKMSPAMIYGIAGAVAVTLIGGLMLWAPWKTERGASSASPQHAAALKLLGSVYTNSVGAEMVYIPPGEFMLGSTKEEQAWAIANGAKEEFVQREGEQPRKAAVKPGFWIGRTEVTVGQWKQFVAATGYKTDAENKGFVSNAPRKGQPWGQVTGLSWRDPGFGSPPQDNHPVCCISWNDAMAFCRWATEQERRAGRLPEGFEVRLPAEAEWEYACRAGTQTRFWWGDSEEGAKGRLNWRGSEDGFEWPSPVDYYGVQGRNQFGLADMLGNTSEWCLDEYDARHAHEKCYRDGSDMRVVRGGAFFSAPATVRPAFRHNNNSVHASSVQGFRVVAGLRLDAREASSSVPPLASTTKSGVAPTTSLVAAASSQPSSVYTNTVGAEMVYIPPGEFMLGSTKEEQAWAVRNGATEDKVVCEGEAPRKATIKQGFWMGRTEVTVGQWKQFTKQTGHQTEAEKKGQASVQQIPREPFKPMKGKNWRDPNFGFEPRDEHPVCCVSWNDAKAFCDWLTELERKAGRLPANHVLRLPTEAEWEYACRGGQTGRFWWGESSSDGLGRLNGNMAKKDFDFVAPVDNYGAQGRNGFGLADMLGNVMEWCLDAFDPEQAHEDLWRGESGLRVIRGGSFHSVCGVYRCANRFGSSPSHAMSQLGFRIVMGMVAER